MKTQSCQNATLQPSYVLIQVPTYIPTYARSSKGTKDDRIKLVVPGLWERWIVLKNVIYLSVQNVMWFHKGGKWWMYHTNK